MDILTKSDLIDLAHGAAFLGSGGGGTLSSTLEMIDAHFYDRCATKLVSVEEASEDEGLTAVCGMIGSQTVGHDLANPLAAGYAVDRYCRLAEERGGPPIRRIIPMELGVQSAAVPCMILAQSRGMSVVDGDGAGRSVMTMMNTCYAAYGPSPNPAVAATDKGNWLVSVEEDIFTFSEIARGMAMRKYIGIVGVSLWAMDAAELQKTVKARGGLSTAREVGAALRGPGDKVERVLQLLESKGRWARELFRGKITKVDSSKMDYSTVQVAGADGATYTVLTSGESIVARKGDQPIGLGPDSLCWITPDGQAFSNTAITETPSGDGQYGPGSEVVMIGIAANPALRDSGYIMFYFNRFRADVDSHEPYAPIEDLYTDHH